MTGNGERRRKRAERFTVRPKRIHNPIARETIDVSLHCGPKSKYTYPTRAAAKRAAVAAINSFGGEKQPYECKTCGWWHLWTPTTPRLLE